MKIIPLAIPGVLRIEERVFHDERGSFAETYRQSVFDAAVGRPVVFVQDNYSRSTRNVLRGLHYQVEQPQGKLLRVTEGSVFDVVVDLRRSSPTFGHWIAETLSADNRRQLWIPEGLAHGFLVLSEHAVWHTRPARITLRSISAAWHGTIPRFRLNGPWIQIRFSRWLIDWERNCLMQTASRNHLSCLLGECEARTNLNRSSARPVPTRMMPAPARIGRVTGSSSSHAPQMTPKTGTKKVTLTAPVGPTLAINRKKMM